ncbi:MAG: DedA family protein [Cellulomonas sp.]|nr:DedA family protein [Cellulomonas sp.]
MTSLVNELLTVSPVWVYLLVGLLVFAEDAIFVGFVLPGETAAVLGGVDASLGHVNVLVVLAVVVVAAIVGDSVGYEVGLRLGPRILRARPLQRHQERLAGAQDLLARRGGPAVFLGRFVAFFRAVMPALAGVSRMHYPTFLRFNAAGGLVWGTAFVLLGYLAGTSYPAVERTVGHTAVVVVLVVLGVGLIVWRLRRRTR